MVLGDPALVIALCGASGNARRLGARGGGVGVGRLFALLGLIGALGLGEEGLDPRLVDKVEGAGEDGREDHVEEDAAQAATA